MANIKLKPDDPPLYYVGIDGTNALDTIAWGNLWESNFGWRNLLWELAIDPLDKQRRVDKAHPLLPNLQEERPYRGNKYTNTCIQPYGKDGKGLDSKWPSQTNIFLNFSTMDQTCDFMRTFILSPGANKATSSLNDTGEGVVACIVYISSHAVSTGLMYGESYNHEVFSLPEAVTKGRQFSGPDWVVLSNCRTLTPFFLSDWTALMGGKKPLRGIIGFQETCPLAPGSADMMASFIARLANGKTILEAWSGALTALNLESAWVVLCHENAQGDTINDWNTRKLKPIPPGSSKFLGFNKTNPGGFPVIPRPDPFTVLWSKGIPPVMITGANRDTQRIAAGDTVTITVKPPGGGTFTAGTTVTITLIFIRPDYPKQAINVKTMFTIKGQTGASAPTTEKRNLQRPRAAVGSDGDDSWILTVVGTPTEVTLTLDCVDLDLSKRNQIDLPQYYLRVRLSGPPPIEFDFIRNGTILAK
jgi:hypothetical protein